MSFHDCLIWYVLQHKVCIFLPLGGMDYVGLGIVHLQLQPGQRSVQYSVTVVNDDLMEVDEEKFTLRLSTEQDRVATLTGFDHSVVTIVDDDSKLHKNLHHICEL